MRLGALNRPKDVCHATSKSAEHTGYCTIKFIGIHADFYHCSYLLNHPVMYHGRFRGFPD
jgi:hypothetical protein